MMSLYMFKGEPISLFPNLKCSLRRVVKVGVIDKKNIKKVFFNQDIYKIYDYGWKNLMIGKNAYFAKVTDLSKLSFKQANQR
jgi:hypothetical protein